MVANALLGSPSVPRRIESLKDSQSKHKKAKVSGGTPLVMPLEKPSKHSTSSKRRRRKSKEKDNLDWTDLQWPNFDNDNEHGRPDDIELRREDVGVPKAASNETSCSELTTSSSDGSMNRKIKKFVKSVANLKAPDGASKEETQELRNIIEMTTSTFAKSSDESRSSRSSSTVDTLDVRRKFEAFLAQSSTFETAEEGSFGSWSRNDGSNSSLDTTSLSRRFMALMQGQHTFESQATEQTGESTVPSKENDGTWDEGSKDGDVMVRLKTTNTWETIDNAEDSASRRRQSHRTDWFPVKQSNTWNGSPEVEPSQSELEAAFRSFGLSEEPKSEGEAIDVDYPALVMPDSGETLETISFGGRYDCVEENRLKMDPVSSSGATGNEELHSTDHHSEKDSTDWSGSVGESFTRYDSHRSRLPMAKATKCVPLVPSRLNTERPASDDKGPTPVLPGMERAPRRKSLSPPKDSKQKKDLDFIDSVRSADNDELQYGSLADSSADGSDHISPACGEEISSPAVSPAPVDLLREFRSGGHEGRVERMSRLRSRRRGKHTETKRDISDLRSRSRGPKERVDTATTDETISEDSTDVTPKNDDLPSKPADPDATTAHVVEQDVHVEGERHAVDPPGMEMESVALEADPASTAVDFDVARFPVPIEDTHLAKPVAPVDSDRFERGLSPSMQTAASKRSQQRPSAIPTIEEEEILSDTAMMHPSASLTTVDLGSLDTESYQSKTTSNQRTTVDSSNTAMPELEPAKSIEKQWSGDRVPEMRSYASESIREYWESIGSVKTMGSFDSVSRSGSSHALQAPTPSEESWNQKAIERIRSEIERRNQSAPSDNRKKPPPSVVSSTTTDYERTTVASDAESVESDHNPSVRMNRVGRPTPQRRSKSARSRRSKRSVHSFPSAREGLPKPVANSLMYFLGPMLSVDETELTEDDTTVARTENITEAATEAESPKAPCFSLTCGSLELSLDGLPSFF